MEGIKIGNKKSKYPIIQGGMGVGVSMHNLAGNVSKEGGIGIISTADIGYQEADFNKNPLKANLRAIGNEIKKAREIAGEDKIIGVNIMVALKDYAEIVKECVKQKIDLIISGAGIPKELPEYVKGSKTKIAPIVSSLRCCKLIVKHWIKKYNYVPDMIVIEGPEAGGHLGFKREELEEDAKPKLENITKEIVNYINEVEKETKKERGWDKSPSLSIIFGLSSKTQWLSGLYYADFISFYSPTQLCGGGTTKSNSNELPISVPLSLSFVANTSDFIENMAY